MDTGPVRHDAQTLRDLSAGALVGVKSTARGVRKISVGRDPICRQLAGLEFEVPAISNQAAFVQRGDQRAVVVLISADGEPCLVRLKDECEGVLLLAGDDVPDLEAVTPLRASALDYFPALHPL